MEHKTIASLTPSALTTLIHRLEAATSRLEDIASTTFDGPKSNGPVGSVAALAPPPPPASAPAAAQAPPKPAAPKAEPLPESIEEFDTFLNGAVKKFVGLSDGLGGAIAKQVSVALL